MPPVRRPLEKCILCIKIVFYEAAYYSHRSDGLTTSWGRPNRQFINRLRWRTWTRSRIECGPPGSGLSSLMRNLLSEARIGLISSRIPPTSISPAATTTSNGQTRESKASMKKGRRGQGCPGARSFRPRPSPHKRFGHFTSGLALTLSTARTRTNEWLHIQFRAIN